MKPGESFVGQPIRSLQTMLRTIAQVDPQQISVIPDGVYSSQTSDAVRSFQENNGLNPTGVTDQDTWERIVEAYGPAQIETSPAQPIYITLNPGQTFRKGDRHHHINLVQAMLLVLSQAYPGFPIVELTGLFDDATEAAIITLQTLSDLPVNGVLDKRTWKHLVLHHAQASDLLERAGR